MAAVYLLAFLEFFLMVLWGLLDVASIRFASKPSVAVSGLVSHLWVLVSILFSPQLTPPKQHHPPRLRPVLGHNPWQVVPQWNLVSSGVVTPQRSCLI